MKLQNTNGSESEEDSELNEDQQSNVNEEEYEDI